MLCIDLVSMLKLGSAHLVSQREWKTITLRVRVAFSDFVEQQHLCVLET